MRRCGPLRQRHERMTHAFEQDHRAAAPLLQLHPAVIGRREVSTWFEGGVLGIAAMADHGDASNGPALYQQ